MDMCGQCLLPGRYSFINIQIYIFFRNKEPIIVFIIALIGTFAWTALEWPLERMLLILVESAVFALPLFGVNAPISAAMEFQILDI